MFQDAAGTTPAVVGGPVGLMLDKSGKGNHASQTTSSAKPVLRQSGGLYYLQPDGVDDYLGVGQAFNLETFTVCASFTGENNQRVLDNRGTGDPGAVKGWQLKSHNSTDVITVDDGAGHYWMWDAFESDGASHVSTLRYTPNDGLWRADQVEKAPANTSASMGSILSAVEGRLFSPSQGTGQRFNGRFYGAVVVGSYLSTADMSLVETYLAEKSGVTL